MAYPKFYANGDISGFDIFDAEILGANKKGVFVSPKINNEQTLYGFCHTHISLASTLKVSIIKEFQKKHESDTPCYLFRVESVIHPFA